ncbi:hypothetical protein BDV93DRAFT_580102 [Ceratobasidium sp. AG-I]|nr:hypothetical protein BDV93DRAFT_580102 [Ceratobasidium sp. AG-I]
MGRVRKKRQYKFAANRQIVSVNRHCNRRLQIRTNLPGLLQENWCKPGKLVPIIRGGCGAEGSRSRSRSRTESGSGGSPEHVRDERSGGSEELEKKLAALAKRTGLLLADIAQLTSQKSNIELELNRYKYELVQIKAALGSERESRARELTIHSKTIADLQNNLKAAQTQAEFAETQRKYALDGYNRALTQAKRLAGENLTLHSRAEKLEKQVDVGIRQLREGSKAVAEGLKQKIKGLEA